MTDERVITTSRVLSVPDATALVGTEVGADLEPTFRSPRDGHRVRIVDDTGETIAIVSRLTPRTRVAIRRVVTTAKYGENVMRQGRRMSVLGATFGYAPPKAMVRQEGCRMGAFGRDNPDSERVLEAAASELSAEFDRILPAQAEHDRATVNGSVLADWRMSESTWTSGVINSANVLPYHRDGNNLETWSAMPTFRYGMDGGRLHIPEYGLVMPCGDGDVTWFYGRGLVHGVTPMLRRRPDAYRYSLVFYALRGMVNCATYAEETRRVAQKRTARERAEAAAIRSKAGLPPASAVPLPEATDLPDGEPLTLADSFPE